MESGLADGEKCRLLEYVSQDPKYSSLTKTFSLLSPGFPANHKDGFLTLWWKVVFSNVRELKNNLENLLKYRFLGLTTIRNSNQEV